MLSYTLAAVTPAEASAYVAARGLTGWPVDEPAQAAALRRGQDAIARDYNERWADEWGNDDPPELVKFAIIEAGVVEARDPGFLTRVVKASDAKMLTRVGDIGWTPVPGPGGVEALRPRLLHVEAMLAPRLRSRAMFLLRA